MGYHHWYALLSGPAGYKHIDGMRSSIPIDKKQDDTVSHENTEKDDILTIRVGRRSKWPWDTRSVTKIHQHGVVMLITLPSGIAGGKRWGVAKVKTCVKF